AAPRRGVRGRAARAPPASLGAAAVRGPPRRRRGPRGDRDNRRHSAARAHDALREGDLAAYHGVEHKAIGAYERGSDDPTTAPKEHDRCGSNLIAPLIVLSAAGQLIVDRAIAEPAPLPRAAAGLGSVSGAVELFAYADRRPGSPFGRAFHAIGR